MKSGRFSNAKSGMKHRSFDLIVVGGGSAGFGAALAAGRRGIRTLLIERERSLGGTATLAGVNTWEPGVGGPGFPFELYRLLAARSARAAAISRTVKQWESRRPWALSRIDPALSYERTLRRCGVPPGMRCRATFEPDLMASEMLRLLSETGCVETTPGWNAVCADVSGRTITAIIAKDAGGREWRIPAGLFVDATGELRLAISAGCSTAVGAEAKPEYGEPHAPPEPDPSSINGVSLCYRVTPADYRCVEKPAAGQDMEPLPLPHSITEYPCGDLNMNPLPIMEGAEYLRMGPGPARTECELRVRRAWLWLQLEQGFDRYRLAAIFPMTGVREGPRLLARRMLTENDILAGCSGGRDWDCRIAIADHAIDIHGRGGRCVELTQPYGVPYGCLVPREIDNLLVAGRAAGFTHIAASSCRLTRTMMDLGHAAGIAAAISLRSRMPLAEVRPAPIREELRKDNVILDPDDPIFRPHNVFDN